MRLFPLRRRSTQQLPATGSLVPSEPERSVGELETKQPRERPTSITRCSGGSSTSDLLPRACHWGCLLVALVVVSATGACCLASGWIWHLRSAPQRQQQHEQQKVLPLEWELLTDLLKEQPTGVSLLLTGRKQVPFERALPLTVDPQLVASNIGKLSLIQALEAPPSANLFTHVSPEFVADFSEELTCVQGEYGLLFQPLRRRVLHQKFHFFERVEGPPPLPDYDLGTSLEKKVQDGTVVMLNASRPVAVVLQRFGWMYYHLVCEMLGRVLLLEELLPPQSLHTVCPSLASLSRPAHEICMRIWVAKELHWCRIF